MKRKMFRHAARKVVCAVAVLLQLLVSNAIWAQKHSLVLVGRVYESTGSGHKPLPGAVVRIPSLSIAVTSDMQGIFTLKLPRGQHSCQVTFVGYTPLTHTINVPYSSDTLRLVLQSNATLMNEVVVTGTGTEHYIKDAPVQTEVITRRMLRSFGGRTISEILSALAPGFDMTQSDMGSRLSVGGLSGSYVLVLVNGKRIAGDVGGQADLQRISTADIERIEVVKGAASTLYGSDAIAGVVNIITRKYTDLPLVIENSTQIGSYNDLRQNNILSFTLGSWSSVSKFAAQRSDGWQNSTQEYYRHRLYDNVSTKTVSAFNNWKVDQELSWQPNKEWRAAVSGMYYTKRIIHEPGAPRWRSYNLRYHDYEVRGDLRYTPTDRSRMSIDLSAIYTRHIYYYDYYNTYIDEYYDPEDNEAGSVRLPKNIVYYPGDHSIESNQGELTLHLKGVTPIGAKHLLSGGIEYRNEDLISPKRMVRPRATAFTLSGYIQDEWNPLDHLNITTGIRLVGHQAFGFAATPKASLLYKIGRFALRSSYAIGFKAPSIKELYYFYERPIMGKIRLYIGNEDLKPQYSQYISLGSEYHSNRLRTSLTASYNRVRDMIALVQVPIPDGYKGDEGSDYDRAMKYVNMEHADLTSIEYSLTYTLPKGFSIGGSYTYTHAVAQLINEEASEQQGKPIIEQRIIDGTSAHKGNVRLRWLRQWQQYGMSIALFGRAQSQRIYKEYGNAPGFHLWRLTTTHTYTPQQGRWSIEGSLGIDNLLDYSERHPYGYNYGTTTPGRTYFASLLVRFDSNSKERTTSRRRK